MFLCLKIKKEQKLGVHKVFIIQQRNFKMVAFERVSFEKITANGLRTSNSDTPFSFRFASLVPKVLGRCGLIQKHRQFKEIIEMKQ